MTTTNAPGRATVGDEPKTLQQAHDLLRRSRPRGTVSSARWSAFYQEAARVYATVARVDADHHFEALAYASAAKDDAEKFRAATVPAARKEDDRGCDRNLPECG